MGTTSNYSWPYPESTDPVADGAADIQALADAADTTGRAIQLATVQVFADSTARDTALSGIEIEGMFAFLQDTDGLTYWDGSAWQDFATGPGIANFTDTATGTYSAGGKNYKYLTFTGSGTITFDTDGLATLLVVGGGGGGGATAYAPDHGGGGGGGQVLEDDFYFTAGTYTVTVGAGGTGGLYSSGSPMPGYNGNSSLVGNYQASGGGGGGAKAFFGAFNYGRNGASGGGAAFGSGGGGGTAYSTLTGNDGAGPGGGGGAGGLPSGTTGGVGASSSITNTPVTYGAGGNAGGTTAGGANTGDGGQGPITSVNAPAGGSGIVVVRVEV